MTHSDLKELLNEKATYYEQNWFIEHDPISIPHQFSQKEDIEISAFLSATIAWGQRKTIINNARKLVDWMDHAPHDFILNHQEADLKKMTSFVHRTFNSDDLLYFIYALQKIYSEHNGLEAVFSRYPDNPQQNISAFKQLFFSWEHLKRTEKHVSDPMKKSSAKRLNMFLRWMVRSDKNGVDFGIWKQLSPKHLMLPLDVHTANVGRKLNLLQRKQNDWPAVEELTKNLRAYDAEDPVKYDFALFGIGVFEKS
tara:strand:+ start:166 stop:924 length:759 start_codon:yes stop_codon:yes gene_type:complete